MSNSSPLEKDNESSSSSHAPRVLLLACGGLGTALGQRLKARGWSVTAIRRNPPANSPSNLSPATSDGLNWIRADLADGVDAEHLLAADYIVYTPSPSGRALAAYEQLYGTSLSPMLSTVCESPRLKLWLQISSTSVYGQEEGEWVDEYSVAESQSPSAQWIRHAERALLNTLAQRAAVLRFSGIYGGHRQYLLRRVAQGKALRAQHFTNRIHEEDCVGLMESILLTHAQGAPVAPIYVGTDRSPVSEWHIGAWLANQMGVPVPPRIDGKPITGKRCVSRCTDKLPYVFKYPTYELGYGAQIKELMMESSDWLAQLR